MRVVKPKSWHQNDKRRAKDPEEDREDLFLFPGRGPKERREDALRRLDGFGVPSEAMVALFVLVFSSISLPYLLIPFFDMVANVVP